MHTTFLLQILNVRLLLVIEWEINSLRNVLRSQHFYNTFTTNYKLYIESNFNLNSQFKL